MSTPARAANDRPLVGITTDIVVAAAGRLKCDCGLAYAQRVVEAGGTPILLPAIPDLAGAHAALCDAFVFTGGDDPRTEPFGEPTHAQARPVHEQRQAYETLLLELLRERTPQKPVLGVCLGMQMMSLVAGGRLDQHLPDSLASAADHKATHPIVPTAASPKPVLDLRAGPALSSHHQGVCDPGPLAVLARSHDGLIEGVADLSRPFYVGVQWHPERTENPWLGQRVFDQLIVAARR